MLAKIKLRNNEEKFVFYFIWKANLIKCDTA